MTDSQVLYPATAERIVHVIGAARARLVVIAPALPLSVCRALAEQWRSLGAEAVSVTLDVDPEVYRLGYGDCEGLELLERTGAIVGGMLQRHAGVRIGIVLADDQLFVFAPVPRLVEAGPRSPDAHNAVMLGKPSQALEAAIGIGSSGAATQEIGLDKATLDDIRVVEEDLRVNPPQAFDLSRAVRVFNAAFQFVELEVTGTSLSRWTAKLPNHLLGVADAATRDALRTTLKLVPPSSELSGEYLREQRQRLERRYLHLIPGFGYALLRTDKQAFLMDMGLFKAEVERFQRRAEAELGSLIADRIDELARALLPRLLEEPPPQWLLGEPPSDVEVECERCLREDLRRALGAPGQHAGRMGVRLVFKDVTIESLRDSKFLVAARKAFPEVRQLHQEFPAAPGA